MDKHWYKKYDDEKYALKQLSEVKHDISSLAKQIEDKLDEIEKIECGLTRGHKWELYEFTSKLYPLAKPPGMYIYKCKYCGEKIFLKAHEKKKWENAFR